jgi:hypothetical protein
MVFHHRLSSARGATAAEKYRKDFRFTKEFCTYCMSKEM